MYQSANQKQQTVISLKHLISYYSLTFCIFILVFIIVNLFLVLILLCIHSSCLSVYFRMQMDYNWLFFGFQIPRSDNIGWYNGPRGGKEETSRRQDSWIFLLMRYIDLPVEMSATLTDCRLVALH